TRATCCRAHGSIGRTTGGRYSGIGQDPAVSTMLLPAGGRAPSELSRRAPRCRPSAHDHLLGGADGAVCSTEDGVAHLTSAPRAGGDGATSGCLTCASATFRARVTVLEDR